MNVYFAPEIEEQIKELYIQGLSAREIKGELNLVLSVRQIQRRLKKWGVIRSQADSFRMAVKRGKVPYERKKK
ncbi:Clr5 domain-containing protein [Candidatus Dojkabacteria bacterium]|jgi:hypothetical protein|nr:Clr5 domain-containing protein [Candidatus Dojkabacteria bacterium]